MRWRHKTSLDWLRARQSYLTASDIRKLIPFTKTGRKRTVTEEMKLEVLASKLVTLTEDDCVSAGMAARGHILEPYAVKAFSDAYCKEDYVHIDDRIIYREDGSAFPLAFSPDAMTKEAASRLSNLYPWTVSSELEDIKFNILEIKSYSPGKHLALSETMPDEIEERWQIATAMAVCDSLENGRLVMYCPDMKDNIHKLFYIPYSRYDLSKEIYTIRKTHREFIDWCDKWFALTPAMHMYLYCEDDIEKIIEEVEERDRLNP